MVLRRLSWLLTFAITAPAHAARTVAVAYFDNDSGQPALDPLRKGLADMLITDLSSKSAVDFARATARRGWSD